MLLDSHVHIWDPRRLSYPWLATLPSLNRPVLPAMIDRAGGSVTGTIFVEADAAPAHRLDEIAWVSSLDWPDLVGIVAAADLRSDDLPDHLDRLAGVETVVGVRHLLQGEAGDWSRDRRFRDGLGEIGRRGLVFDACLRHGQLDALADLLDTLDGQTIVLDHLGKPPVDQGISSAAGSRWSAALRRIADYPGIYLKLSGVAAETTDPDLFEPRAIGFVDAAVEIFGAGRCMIGSDQPVSTRLGAAVDVTTWVSLVAKVVTGPRDWEQVAGRTARACYGIAPPPR